MGMEVARSELVRGNGEVRVGSFSIPYRKENGKLRLGKMVTQPIQFGSHGADETAKVNGDNVSNANFPKDVADEGPAEQKTHSFYIVRYRSYDEPDLKVKIDQVEKEIWIRNQQRIQILNRIKAKRLDRAQIIEQLRFIGQEQWQYRAIVGGKIKQMKPLTEALGSLRGPKNVGRDKVPALCSSEGKIDGLIQCLNYRMQHGAISSLEEKRLIREIKQLEGTRDKFIANAAMRAKIREPLRQNEAIQNQVKFIGTDLYGVKKREVVRSKIKQLEDEVKAIDSDIGSLQLELTSLIEKRDKAVEKIYELRKERDEANACFHQNRILLKNANELAAVKNIEALKELSHKEVEKFMASWNSSKSFRDDYEKRIVASLEIRQLSRDGRMRNPGEKPLFLLQQFSPAGAHTLTNATPNPATEDLKPVNEQENIPTQSTEVEPKKKLEEQKAEFKSHNEEEEYYVVELPKRENSKQDVVDEAKLKEIKKQEEMEKQKQALERKKKLAEKAAAKAALRAQKEAEKKQKEREKKMKKKESPSNQNEAAKTKADSVEAKKLEKILENIKTAVSVKTKESKNGLVMVRYRGRTKGCDAIPKAILKRRKSNNYILWAAAAAAVVAVILALFYN